MIVALTRPTGAELARCELTHIDRAPIDIARACKQHEAYLETLRSLGVVVVELERLPEHPDAVFVEDAALVLDEIAIVLRPGAPSRRGESESVASELARHRDTVEMSEPATLDGGDIIVLGRRILVGETTRTNRDGVTVLGDLVSPFGYSVEAVPVHGVLHLKSAATVVNDETLIYNRGQVDLGFLDARLIAAHPEEPQGANVVRVGDALLADASAPRTLEMLSSYTTQLRPVHVDEFAKAEGAVSCKGIIFEA